MTITDTKPEVEYDKSSVESTCEYVYDAYRHEDGSITYIVLDTDSEHANPRENDGNVATLIQKNDRLIDIDSDDAGLAEARERFNEATMQRYLAIFRPDILHYQDYWSYGQDGYGWGYVTKEAWDEHMYRKPPEDATDEELLTWVDEEPSCTPEEAFKQEIDVYGQWAQGEVYGAIHVSVGKPIVEYGEHGAYVDEYDTDEDSCWGFLGYDDRKQIAESMTSSPVTEVLY